MEMNKELLEKAKKAKTAEELASLAKENGIELTSEEANTYFAQLNPKGGELADDDLDSVAGGRKCGTIYKDGRPVVAIFNSCEHYHYYDSSTKGKDAGIGWCRQCIHLGYASGGLLTVCNCPERYEN